MNLKLIMFDLNDEKTGIIEIVFHRHISNYTS